LAEGEEAYEAHINQGRPMLFGLDGVEAGLNHLIFCLPRLAASLSAFSRCTLHRWLLYYFFGIMAWRSIVRVDVRISAIDQSSQRIVDVVL